MGKKVTAPYLLSPNDPHYTGKSLRGKSKKVLTKADPSGIIERVRKLIRKDDKMAKDKNKKSKVFSVVKSLAWLLLAAQQAFAGYVLLSNFDNYFVIATALVSLGIAGVIITLHFALAHK